MTNIERWDVFICPECGTLYPDLSSMCECQVGSELVQPERVTAVPEQQLRGAVAARDALDAALQHVLRDPAIAHHAGWQDDARKALAAARGQ